jgi:AcrR family transcriptional regulator
MTGPAAARRGGGRRGPAAQTGRTGQTAGGSRSGRRSGDSGTREAILAAARRRFGDHGYDGATIRGIAADAGVDAALVHHFFGTKERLFAAAMRLPIVPGELVAAALDPGTREPGQSLGEHLLRTLLGAWDVPEVRATFLGLLRSAVTSEQAAGMLREFATESILGRLAGAVAPGAADDDAQFRAALVASQVLGLGLARYVLGLGPLAQAGSGDLAAAIGPTLERYLTGELR